MALELGELGVRITADLKDFKKGIGGATKRMEQMSREMRGIALGASAAFAGLSIGVGKLVKFASDAEENLNVLNVTFEDLTPNIRKFARETSNATGRSILEIEKMTASAGALIKPMVGSTDAAAGMSKKMAALAVDMSSFFNVADQDAFAALRSGLIGQSEPLLRFGVNVQEAALATFALSKGIKKSTTDMGAGEKATLRLQLIMSKLKDVQGDAARTAGSFANVIKAIQGQTANLAQRIGAALLPTLAKMAREFLKVINIVKRIRPEFITMIAKGLLLSTGLAGIAAALFTVGAAIGPAIVAFKTLATVMAFISGSIIVPLAAIALGLAGLMLIFVNLKKLWVANSEAMTSAFDEFKTAVLGTLDEISRTFSKFIKKGLRGAVTFFSFLKNEPEELNKRLKKVDALDFSAILGGAGESAREAAERIVEGIKEGTEDDVDFFQDLGKDIKADLISGGKDLKKLIESAGIDTTGIDKLIDAFGGKKGGFKGLFEREFLGGGGGGGAAGSGSTSKLSPAEELDSLFAEENAKISEFQRMVDTISARRIKAINDELLSDLEVEQLERDLAKEADKNARKTADQQAKAVGSQITSAFGKLGGLASSIQQGFEAGGPIGAAVAAFLELAKNIQSFADFQAVAGQVFDEAVAAVKPLVDAVMPAFSEVVMALGGVFKAVGGVFKIIGPVIGQIARQILRPLIKQLQGFAEVIKAMQPIIAILAETFKAISSIFELTFAPVTENLVGALKVAANVIRFAAKTILFIFRPFIELFNAIVRFVGEAARKIGNAIVDIGFKDTGRAIREWGKRLKKSQINLDALNDALNKTESTARDTGEALCDESPSSSLCGVLDDASTDLKGTISEIGQELTNVPKGFKTALAQFEATDTRLSVGGAPSPTDQGLAEQGFNRTIIENMNVIAPDPQKFSEELGEIAQWQNFRDTGSPVTTPNNPFLVPATGGATQ